MFYCTLYSDKSIFSETDKLVVLLALSNRKELAKTITQYVELGVKMTGMNDYFSAYRLMC